jgi:hypothetical protein
MGRKPGFLPASSIGRLFAEPKSLYLHVHYAAPGCYAAGGRVPLSCFLAEDFLKNTLRPRPIASTHWQCVTARPQSTAKIGRRDHPMRL